ncbi:hypothetical protein CJ030_MR2G016874 [Morella rubra]|uniref:Uncharacterized protein n=1 Tax=Morella rubra TaxID=262757 RepID=A0A6A1WGK2_9ROSI|nr:hypothetical protein CJ030_MR2G016874 [Morella rubra]
MAELSETMRSVMQPTHQMLSDISARLTALEEKVGQLEFEWKKEVAAIRSDLKDVTSDTQLHALTLRVSVIEDHMSVRAGS